jgi:hypothetical protein
MLFTGTLGWFQELEVKSRTLVLDPKLRQTLSANSYWTPNCEHAQPQGEPHHLVVSWISLFINEIEQSKARKKRADYRQRSFKLSLVVSWPLAGTGNSKEQETMKTEC